MHPFIPFVTEEIYSKINTQDECLSLAAWPKINGTLIDANASKDMQTIIDDFNLQRKKNKIQGGECKSDVVFLRGAFFFQLKLKKKKKKKTVG